MSDALILGPWTAGEKPEPVVVEFNNADGTNTTLTGTVVAKVTFRVNAGTAVTRDATWDNTAGKLTWTPTATDLAVPGVLAGEAWIGNGTNRYASKRLAARVRTAAAVPTI